MISLIDITSLLKYGLLYNLFLNVSVSLPILKMVYLTITHYKWFLRLSLPCLNVVFLGDLYLNYYTYF